MMTWEPWPGPLGPIVAGESDGYIRDYASAAAAFGSPMMLRFGHEMNLRGISWSGTPDLYRAAWARIHSIFTDTGASNVRFVWSPHVVGRNATSFTHYYPGHDLVDWVALDGYNWGRRRWRNRWQTFDAIFAASYRAIAELAPDKPVVIAEIGCAERGGDKATWMRDALFDAIPGGSYPALRAIVWFDQFPAGHADWRIGSSPGAMAAWRDAVADPRYALTGEELLAV
jgi:mannan endo-1,4-beta-mannosidase